MTPPRDRRARRRIEPVLAMRLATPRWWYRRESGPWFVVLLRPASWIWAWATARRLRRAIPYDAGVPVICVGNLTVGGSGKTPVARELARRLGGAAGAAHILLAGHGGRLTGPVRVDARRHTAADVGDEAVMLAADAPVWVARDRAAGARAAVEAGAAIIVMDDGHQNPDVEKSLSLVVVDAETRDGEWPFGPGRVLPAGPLREPLTVGLARADAVVLLLPAEIPAADEALCRLFDEKPILIARLGSAAAPPAGPRLGFAAIGKPWKMERALRAAGCDLVDFVGLADHATLSEATLTRLAARARSLAAGLVCSEKDWARLPPAWRDRVAFWPVRAEFESYPEFIALFDAKTRPPAAETDPLEDFRRAPGSPPPRTRRGQQPP